jgi:hypothetical protein
VYMPSQAPAPTGGDYIEYNQINHLGAIGVRCKAIHCIISNIINHLGGILAI